MLKILNKAVYSDTSQEFYISEVIGRKIYDNYGHKVGRVKDLVAVWEAGNPEVVGIKLASSSEIIPLNLIAEFGRQAIYLKTRISQDQVREVDENEIFVNRWLLDKQIVDIRGAKVVRVNDIKLRWFCLEGRVHITLIAVDIGLRGMLRRMGLRLLANKAAEKLLIWDHFKPLTTRTENLELVVPAEYIANMHPADIADIIENLDTGGQMEVLKSLDTDTAADTLAEVEAEERSQLMESISAQQAYVLIEAMSPDVAADVLSDLPMKKRVEILSLIDPDTARELRDLMSYPEGTAGSLMTTELIEFNAKASIQQVFSWLQEEQPDFETWNELFVIDDNEQLIGVVPLRALMLSPPETSLGDMVEETVRLKPEDDYGKVLEYTVKYGLLALPVVDERDHLIGNITVDDVLTSLVEDPRNRRRLEEDSYLSILKTLKK
ncbi:MAG TPA: CBS domain-containing protein [Syntrophomonadaceae bacterium]|nr:CBS domain-containing protein [Syntrophomonadaceae bacterium]